jgi:probable HAF family extracellular repeat protein
MTDLGTLPGDYESFADAINNRGDIVGTSTSPTYTTRLFFDKAGVMAPLPALPGSSDPVAASINIWDQIVGTVTTSMRVSHAFVVSGTTMIDLGTLPGYSNSSANCINVWGWIVGYVSNSPPLPGHGFLDIRGKMVDLNTLVPPGTPWTIREAAAINDRGQITATADSTTTGQTHAVLLNPVH